MAITAIPRTMVKASLLGLRVPLTALERVTGNAGSDEWPPTMAFDAFEGRTKTVLGSLLRDDTLVREGELQQAKVRELTTARRLELRAEQVKQEADVRLHERAEVVEERREDVEDEVADRRREVERQAAEREREIAKRAQQRDQAAQQAQKRRTKAVIAAEREAEKTRIREESEALAAKGEALAAARAAEAVDDAIETTKAKRKSS